MSSCQNTQEVRDELRDTRERGLKEGYKQHLRQHIYAMCLFDPIDAALKVNSQAILAKTLRELADEIEKVGVEYGG